MCAFFLRANIRPQHIFEQYLPGRRLPGRKVLLDVGKLSEASLPRRQSGEVGGHIGSRASVDGVEDVEESDFGKGELGPDEEALSAIVLEEELLKATEPTGDDLLSKVLLKSLLVVRLGVEDLDGSVGEVLDTTLELIDLAGLVIVGAVETVLARNNAKNGTALAIVLS